MKMAKVSKNDSSSLRNSTPALSVPQTQNTAPVLEFNCLYTRDIRRKQKRWQDGFLRFHTFNKRVMLYDVPRNFIGDTHWKADEALQDGDEVTLEKDGVMIQVAESTGSTETDLTELKKSRKKGSSNIGSSSPAKPVQVRTPIEGSVISRSSTQLKHRSLNALLGTSKGRIGKARVSTKSPFEERNGNCDGGEWPDGRPAKRQRLEETAAWNVTCTTRAAERVPKKETPLWARKVDSAKKRPALQKGQQTLATKRVIVLTEDMEEGTTPTPGLSSDAPSPKESRKAQSLRRNGREKQLPVRSSSPAFQTQRLAATESRTGEQALPSEVSLNAMQPTGLETRGNQPQGSDRMLGCRAELESAQKRERAGRVEAILTTTTESPIAKRGQTLRMAANSSKKRTLLCQDRVSQKPSRVHSENTENAIGALLNTASEDHESEQAKPKSQRKKLQERLTKIARKSTAEQSAPSGAQPLDTTGIAPPPPPPLEQQQQQPRTTSAHTSSTTRISSLEQSAVELAEFDRMIMPSEPPRSPDTEPPLQETWHLRRVVSGSNSVPSPKPKRVPGAPVRFTPTPSPAKKSPRAAPSIHHSKEHVTDPKPATALPPKSRARKNMQRAVSLNTTSNGTSTVILSKPFQAPKPPSPKAVVPDQVADPWSREAFDLFTWRPPGWNEENWCMAEKPRTG